MKTFILLFLGFLFIFTGMIGESGTMPLFIFGFLFIIAIPKVREFLYKSFRFTSTASFMVLVGMGISALSFPLLGIIAGLWLAINSEQEAWGFVPSRSPLPESTRE